MATSSRTRASDKAPPAPVTGERWCPADRGLFGAATTPNWWASSVGDSLSDGETLSDDADSLADGDADPLSPAVALGDGAHSIAHVGGDLTGCRLKLASSLAFNDPPPACSMVEGELLEGDLISAEASLGSAVNMAFVGSVQALNASRSPRHCRSRPARPVIPTERATPTTSFAAWQKASAWLTSATVRRLSETVSENSGGLVGFTEDPALSTPLPQPVRIRRAAVRKPRRAPRHLGMGSQSTLDGAPTGYGAASLRE